MASFKEALKEGLKIEDIVLDTIRKKYPRAYSIVGKCKEGDIKIPELGILIEVKRDVKSLETGNFVVEIEMFDKPSGLLSTKSKYWVFCDEVELIWVEVDTLKNHIIYNSWLKPAKFVGNGDVEPKRAFLIKTKEIRKIAATIMKFE